MEIAPAPVPVDRPSHIIGRFGGTLPGPTVLVTGAIHGNEPSGLRATERVLQWLEQAQPRFRGRFIGLAGNLEALERGDRFIEEDLNRIWLQDRVDGLRETPAEALSVDGRQQAELLSELDAVFEEAPDSVYFLDLHTSSARGEPFVCIGDTLRNRAFAMQFPVPVILGLEEQIDGALLEYVNNLGHVTVGVEAGQHDHPESIDRHEAFVLLALISAGCLDEEQVPQAEAMRRLLRDAVGELPPVLEVRYRHAITPDDGFTMEPGYTNFQRVQRDELLATERRGEIRATESGRVLLPLYQGLGNDGFFIVRSIRPFWLGVSAWLRHIRADRVLPLLPGVQRDPEDPEALCANPHIARWLAVNMFHLLGYRKLRSSGARLRFSRRVEDF